MSLRKAISDREVVLTFLSQAVNLIFPLLLLKIIITNFSESDLLLYESVISLVLFFGIAIDFSTSLFLAGKSFSKASLSKYYFSAIVLRTINWLFSLLGLALLKMFFGGDLLIYYIASFLLFVNVFDSSYIYLKKNIFYQYNFLVSIKYIALLLMVTIGEMLPVIALLVASILFSILSFLRVKEFISFSFKISRRFISATYKKYYKNASTDFVTAIFTQLDSYIISVAITSEIAVVYVTVRKIIRAAMSLSISLYKISYVRWKNAKGVKSVRDFIIIYFIGAFSFFIVFDDMIFEQFLGVEYDSTWKQSFYIQLSLLFLGYLKSRIVFNYLYAKELFGLNLGLTLTSTLGYIVLMYFASYMHQGWWPSMARVAAEIIFVLFFYIIVNRKALFPLYQNIRN